MDEIIIKYQAIIFDMDGVIVDSEDFYQKRRARFLEGEGLTLEGVEMNELIGSTFKDLWPKLFKGVAYTEEVDARYQAFKKNNPIPYQSVLNPHIENTLKILKNSGLKIGIASSSSLNDIQLMLESCQLKEYFDVVTSGHDFKRTKPDPEIYQATTYKMGCSPQDCLAIEDSEVGILSAKEAGLTVWALADTKYGMNQAKADKVIAELSEISDKLLNE